MTPPPASNDDEAQRAEFERRKSRIRSMSDRRQAFREAVKLAQVMDVFHSEATQLRNEIAQELRESGYSLRDIGNLVDVSRAWVQNFLGKKPARRKRGGELSS